MTSLKEYQAFCEREGSLYSLQQHHKLWAKNDTQARNGFGINSENFLDRGVHTYSTLVSTL